MHWATGQSALEDSNLAALLAWIDPPTGQTGALAALDAEDPELWPPAGPATDPEFDNKMLAPAMEGYTRALAAVADGDVLAEPRAYAALERELRGAAGPDLAADVAGDRPAARPASWRPGGGPVGRGPGRLHRVRGLRRRGRGAAAAPRRRGYRRAAAAPAGAGAGHVRRAASATTIRWSWRSTG